MSLWHTEETVERKRWMLASSAFLSLRLLSAIDIKALGEVADKYAAHQNGNEKRISSWCVCNLA